MQGDLISRDAVIEQTYLWSKDEFLRITNPFDYLRKRIKNLPPVDPQEPCEVEASKLQQAYNKGFEDCRQAVLEIFGYVMSYWKEHAIDVEPHEIKDALIEQYEFTAKQLSELTPVTSQESKTEHPQKSCDTCEHSDEIDGSNCYECVKGMRDRYNPQEMTGHWTRELIRNEKGGCIGAKMICSECGNDNKHDEYMNYCPNCGARMVESEE